MTAPTDVPKKAANTSEYVVLRLASSGQVSVPDGPEATGREMYELVGTFKGSAEQARKQASKRGDSYDEGSAYVAVPVRSWRPLRPKVKTETRVTFS